MNIFIFVPLCLGGEYYEKVTDGISHILHRLKYFNIFVVYNIKEIK